MKWRAKNSIKYCSEGKGGNEAFIDAITSGNPLEDTDGPDQIRVSGPQNGFIKNDDK